jgi:chromosome partitioning protein
LAERLARLAERAGAGPVVLLDADPNQELTQRCAEAGKSDLIVAPWDASCTGPEFLNLKAKGSGLIIIDAPPLEQRATLSQVLSIADLVAVVVRPLEDDFAPLGKMIDIIESAAKPFLFAVNRAKRHGNMAAATAIALAQYGAICPIILPEDERVAPSLRAKVLGKRKRTDGELKREQFWTYLSGRLETAAAETAALADEALAGEALVEGELCRRSFPRQSFDIGATFTWERRVFPCRIQNISASGLAFTADVSLPLGARLKLQIPYLGEFEAEPVRSNGNTVGLRFVIDKWQQAGLVRDLAGLVNAGRSTVKHAAGSGRSFEAAGEDAA